MEDFKKLSVDALRKLAKRLLGKGYSRLRTRAQLLEALARVTPTPPSPAASGANVAPRAAPAARAVRPPPARKVTAGVHPPGSVAAPAEPPVRTDRTGAPPPERLGGPAAASSARPRRTEVRATPPARPAASAAVRNARPRRTEVSTPPTPPRATPAGALATVERPLESAFFVGGPEAPRPPRRPLLPVPLPEPPAVPLPPADVGTEAPVLLVRDPTTLFVFWDFRRELERGAALGLAEPRLLLRLFHGERLDRSLELPLGIRSTYLEGLQPGEAYSAEATLLGRDGWTRPMGRRSGPRRLPPDGPSEQLTVRTLRLPWSEPLARVGQPSDAVEVPISEALDSPRRVPLPSSPGARGRGRGPTGALRSGRN